MDTYAVGGLQHNTLQNITKLITTYGFNCIRLPFSLTLIYNNPIVPDAVLTANPDLVGIRALPLLDLVVEECRKNQIMVRSCMIRTSMSFNS